MKIFQLLSALLLLSTALMADNTINLRIINGTKVPQHSSQWEWILSLRQNGEHICGASLIAPQWAVTAAHCISEDNGVVPASVLSVMSGSYHVNNGRSVVPVTQVIRYPQYSEVDVDNDIALLRLASAVTAVAPISLANNATLQTGDPAFVAGWGNMSTTGVEFPNDLMEVDLKIIDFNECSRSYGAEGIFLTHNMFCAGYMDGSKDSCQGDSGGPLITPKSSGYELTGVVSFGGSEEQMCGAANFPGIYTKVANYVSWIESYTGVLQREISLENTLKTKGSYAVSGTFGWYDFENVPPAFDWVYQTQSGRIFQLQGKAPSEHDVFGWKEVYGIALQPQWKMISLGSDIDGDGTTKFDWVLVGVNTDAVYKLSGVRENGTFQYSDKLNVRYIIEESVIRFYE